MNDRLPYIDRPEQQRDRRRRRRIGNYTRALAIVLSEMSPAQIDTAARRLELEAESAYRMHDGNGWADLGQVAKGLRAVARSRRRRNHLPELDR